MCSLDFWHYCVNPGLFRLPSRQKIGRCNNLVHHLLSVNLYPYRNIASILAWDKCIPSAQGESALVAQRIELIEIKQTHAAQESHVRILLRTATSLVANCIWEIWFRQNVAACKNSLKSIWKCCMPQSPVKFFQHWLNRHACPLGLPARSRLVACANAEMLVAATLTAVNNAGDRNRTCMGFPTRT